MKDVFTIKLSENSREIYIYSEKEYSLLIKELKTNNEDYDEDEIKEKLRKRLVCTYGSLNLINGKLTKIENNYLYFSNINLGFSDFNNQEIKWFELNSDYQIRIDIPPQNLQIQKVPSVVTYNFNIKKFVTFESNGIKNIYKSHFLTNTVPIKEAE